MEGKSKGKSGGLGGGSASSSSVRPLSLVRGDDALREIRAARLGPPAAMDAGQGRGLAMMLARRTGTTHQGALTADVNQFAQRTGHAAFAATPVPNQHFLQGEIDRTQTLVRAAHHAAGQGANVSELRTAIQQESAARHYAVGPSIGSGRAALAQTLAQDYHHLQRFTDNTPSGNFSYQGRLRHDEGEPPALGGVSTHHDARSQLPDDRHVVRAGVHIAGRGRDVISPFVSLTEHAASANQTSDHGLRDIIRGTVAGPGAPNLDTFMVPRHSVIHPDVVESRLRQVNGNMHFRINNEGSVGQARQEHERLYYGDSVDHFRTDRQVNPYRRSGM